MVGWWWHIPYKRYLESTRKKKKQKIFQESSQHSGYDQFWHVSLFVALFGIVLEIIRVTCTSIHEFSYAEESFSLFIDFYFKNPCRVAQNFPVYYFHFPNKFVLIQRDGFILRIHIYKRQKTILCAEREFTNRHVSSARECLPSAWGFSISDLLSCLFDSRIIAIWFQCDAMMLRGSERRARVMQNNARRRQWEYFNDDRKKSIIKSFNILFRLHICQLCENIISDVYILRKD